LLKFARVGSRNAAEIGISSGPTITLPDIEAEPLAMLIASLGAAQFEDAYQHCLRHWKANEAYSPDVEMNTTDLMGGAAEKLYVALADAGFDVLARAGPR
jgi:hypothetical protein